MWFQQTLCELVLSVRYQICLLNLNSTTTKLNQQKILLNAEAPRPQRIAEKKAYEKTNIGLVCQMFSLPRISQRISASSAASALK